MDDWESFYVYYIEIDFNKTAQKAVLWYSSFMKIQYFDIHSHLNLSPLSETREAVLVKMRELGVGTITVGTGLETSREAMKIADENPDICFATVGIHPTDGDEVFDQGVFEELARTSQVVAIGETGLDYFRDQSPETKQKQTELFKKHIELSIKVGKPLMLHVRASKGTDDAYYDALSILSKYSGIRANFHFFSGSMKCMEDIVSAGFTISVDGPITFSHDYDDMIRACPLESIMVETDAPFAAPIPYRGKTCEPWMVGEIAKKVAELKGLDFEVVRVQLLENTERFFSLDL